MSESIAYIVQVGKSIAYKLYGKYPTKWVEGYLHGRLV